ncbi:MAG: spore photoproduct lyase [Clostridia bacterium]|nr:spore photoproduct lyase [Clostridia bacterium]
MKKKKLTFTRIYYERDVENYELGRFLLDKYATIPNIPIDSHNNIEELRKYENKDFAKLKRYLIVGIRKTHKYTPNYKISHYLVPFTSSGCYAMCMYCYLVCNYNKCSYLRVFVNKEEILDKLIKFSNRATEDLVFEIGSNSDLLLENLVTEDLEQNIEYFLKNANQGKLTFPTKFDMIEPLLKISDKNRVLPRMSLNPQRIIESVEFGTSNLEERIEAINRLVDVGYQTYILIAPVIITENFKEDYDNLITTMKEKLNEKAKSNMNFEVIFMTYSFIHRKINEEAFPKAINLYNQEIMTSRGIGKYHYKESIKEEAKQYIKELLIQNFKDCKIKYIV